MCRESLDRDYYDSLPFIWRSYSRCVLLDWVGVKHRECDVSNKIILCDICIQITHARAWHSTLAYFDCRYLVSPLNHVGIISYRNSKQYPYLYLYHMALSRSWYELGTGNLFPGHDLVNYYRIQFTTCMNWECFFAYEIVPGQIQNGVYNFIN